MLWPVLIDPNFVTPRRNPETTSRQGSRWSRGHSRTGRVAGAGPREGGGTHAAQPLRPGDSVKLGPPAIGALSHRFFFGGGFPYQNRLQKEKGYPYSKLSTGGPRKDPWETGSKKQRIIS